jgi:hypothetical protein
MKGSVDNLIKIGKMILLAESTRNRLLSKCLKLFIFAQCLHFRPKAMGEGLKTGNRG